MLAEDETHLDPIARIRSCWMPHDLRHKVLTPGTNQPRTLHGAVNLITGVWHHHVSVYNRIRQAPAFFRHRTPTQNLTTAAPWLPGGYGQDHWAGA